MNKEYFFALSLFEKNALRALFAIRVQTFYQILFKCENKNLSSFQVQKFKH